MNLIPCPWDLFITGLSLLPCLHYLIFFFLIQFDIIINTFFWLSAHSFEVIKFLVGVLRHLFILPLQLHSVSLFLLLL